MDAVVNKVDCAACAAFAGPSTKLGQKIAPALKVPVLENLASRIPLKRSI
jgi:hypothetical protein